MANRDKSQNVGFVYTNIYQLYKKAQNADAAQVAAAGAASAATQLKSDSRVWRADDLSGIRITAFQPRTLERPAQPAPQARVAQPGERPVVGNPFDDLKQNLEKLQDLHSKLRFMLKELEDLVGKK